MIAQIPREDIIMYVIIGQIKHVTKTFVFYFNIFDCLSHPIMLDAIGIIWCVDLILRISYRLGVFDVRYSLIESSSRILVTTSPKIWIFKVNVKLTPIF